MNPDRWWVLWLRGGVRIVAVRGDRWVTASNAWRWGWGCGVEAVEGPFGSYGEARENCEGF